jgi:MFS family permease
MASLRTAAVDGGRGAVGVRDPLILLGIGIASRLSFRSTILHHWDSVNFALALEHFDISRHQPHPPGTNVVYVFLGRLLQAWVHDANAALVWISVAASGGAVALAFVLGARWFGKREGWTIALLTLSSPLVWFHGEVALTYMLEFLWVLLIVLACERARLGNGAALCAAALLIGFAGGIRANTSVFLFPLWLATAVCSLRARAHATRRLLAALAFMAMGMALWAAPLVALSGGPAAYWDVASAWGAQQIEESGAEGARLLNAARLLMFALYGLGAAVVPIGYVLLQPWQTLAHALQRDWRAQAIVLWVAPALAYLTFVHLRQPGHIFTILPALLVAGGLATALAGRRLERVHRQSWAILTTLVVTANSLFFLCGPAVLFGSSRMLFSAPTWASIRDYDRHVGARLDVVRTHFSPADTAVIASARNFRLPDYYLRDFLSISAEYASSERLHALPDRVHTLVIFDDAVLPQVADGPNVQRFPLAGGGVLRAVSWGAGQRARASRTVLDIQDK